MMPVNSFYSVCPHGHWICDECGYTARRQDEEKMCEHVREQHFTQSTLLEVDSA